MANEPKIKFFGYVKVEILTRYPRRWIWKVCRDTNDLPVVAAETPLSCAESAWDAGRKILVALEHGETEVIADSITLITSHPYGPAAH